jgi:succinate dehydrogenase / fumarate reductase flavoprotein subunit
MYEKITGENPYVEPMRIYPAPHYTMGGLWVDYNLMSSIPGLFVLGEANFSDHGANRLGASALMQGLADGYFVIPYTIGGYLAGDKPEQHSVERGEFKESKEGVNQRLEKLLAIRGKRAFNSIHKELGSLLWEYCGMARTEAGLKKALAKIPEIRDEFWRNVNILGEKNDYNQALELGNRVADFIDFAELLCTDALHRAESCGGHFREESQTEDGEARRDDEHFSYVGAWEYQGAGKAPLLHKEDLKFENVQLGVRSYK